MGSAGAAPRIMQPTAGDATAHAAELARLASEHLNRGFDLDDETYHQKCRCCWCGGRFVLVYGCQWLCEHTDCAARQISHAMLYDDGVVNRTASPYLMLPTPIQVSLELARERNVLIGGAAGGSKSYGLRWHLYRWCRAIPGYQALLLRRTYDELEKNHLIKMRVEADLMADATYQPGPRRMMFENGSMIQAGHCQYEKDIESHLGPEWDEVVFEEAGLFHPRALNEIAPRARTSNRLVMERGGAWVRYGSNPGGAAALYLREHFITKNPDLDVYENYHASDYRFIGAKIEDNPYLPDDYERTSLSGLTKEKYQQLRHGDWNVIVGQFFNTFTEPTHVVSGDPF
jgi:hypothetical protein